MADPIFTNEPPPAVPPKKPMSTAVKLAIGCGVLFLIGAASCGGCVLWGTHAAMSFGSGEWAELQKVSTDLSTDAGAEAIYKAHPGLATSYPTVQDFVGAARLWRPSLEPLPAEMPGITSGRISLNKSTVNGKSSARLGYKLGSGKTLGATFQDGQLVDLTVE